MKIIVIIASLIFFFQTELSAIYRPVSYKDSLVIDSLTVVLNSIKEKEKAAVLNTLASLYVYNNPKKAEGYALESERIAIKFNNKEDLEEALYHLSYIYVEKDLNISLKYLNKSFDLNIETNNLKVRNAIYELYSSIYVNMGLYAKAFKYDLLVLKEAERGGDKKKILRGLINTGVGYAEFKNVDKSIDSYNRAIDLAFEIYKDSLNSNILLCWLNIGCLESSLNNNLDKGLFYIKKALNGYKKTNGSRLKDAIYFTGYTYFKKKEYDLAIYYFNEAYDSAIKYNDNRIGIASLHQLGHMYFIKEDYKSALLYLNKTVILSKKLNYISQLSDGYYKISEVYEAVKNYEEAYRFQKLYIMLKDSLERIEEVNKTKYIEQSFEIEKQQQDLKLLNAKEKTKNIAIYLMVLTIFIVFILVFIIIRNYKYKRKLLLAEKERLAFENEKQANEQLLNIEKSRLLKEQLLHRERELNNKHRLIASKNTILNHVHSKLKSFKSNMSNDNLRYEFEDLNRLINENINQHKNWEVFKSDFEQIHPDLIRRLTDKYPGITITDIKLCVYTRMKFSSKEIAELMSILPASVKNARTRLKKKLGLPDNQSLSERINKM